MKKLGAAGGETVLESRHVVGMFFGIVVLCGIFFALGWVMGRTQYDSDVRAASSTPGKPVAAPKPAADPVPAPSTDWEFLKSRSNGSKDATASKVSPSQPAAPVIPSSNAPAPASSPVATTAPRPTPSSAVKPEAASKLVKSPAIPHGGMVLQVAALRSEADALALADALQQKEFPAFVLTPGAAGNLYRVQVGPYPNAKAADAAKKSLEREGFKTIVKH